MAFFPAWAGSQPGMPLSIGFLRKLCPGSGWDWKACVESGTFQSRSHGFLSINSCKKMESPQILKRRSSFMFLSMSCRGGANLISRLPERRHFPQLRYNAGQDLDDQIDIRFRILDAQTEPDRTVSHRKGNAHGPQNV